MPFFFYIINALQKLTDTVFFNKIFLIANNSLIKDYSKFRKPENRSVRIS